MINYPKIFFVFLSLATCNIYCSQPKNQFQGFIKQRTEIYRLLDKGLQNTTKKEKNKLFFAYSDNYTSPNAQKKQQAKKRDQINSRNNNNKKKIAVQTKAVQEVQKQTTVKKQNTAVVNAIPDSWEELAD